MTNPLLDIASSLSSSTLLTYWLTNLCNSADMDRDRLLMLEGVEGVIWVLCWNRDR